MAASLYLIAESALGPCKIGISNGVWGRLDSLQSGNPRLLRVYKTWPYDGETRILERAIHQVCLPHWIRGEWFDMTVEHLVDLIEAHRHTPEKELYRIAFPPGSNTYGCKKVAEIGRGWAGADGNGAPHELIYAAVPDIA